LTERGGNIVKTRKNFLLISSSSVLNRIVIDIVGDDNYAVGGKTVTEIKKTMNPIS